MRTSSCIAALATVGAASAFVAPTAFTGTTLQTTTASSSSLKMVDITSKVGSSAPFGPWDPLGLGEKANDEQYRNYQTAELKHGRVAMMAALGMVVQEQFHPFFFGTSADIGPAIDHYQLIESYAPKFWVLALSLIGLAEFNQIGRAYTKLDNKTGVASIRDDVIIGDFGFDPFGIVKDEEEFNESRTKELNNGRLAMLAIIGQWAQELINGKELIANLTSQ